MGSEMCIRDRLSCPLRLAPANLSAILVASALEQPNLLKVSEMMDFKGSTGTVTEPSAFSITDIILPFL